LLRDLKDANKKLQYKEKHESQALTITVTAEEKEKIAKVFVLMMQNFKSLFKKHVNIRLYVDKVSGKTFL